MTTFPWTRGRHRDGPHRLARGRNRRPGEAAIERPPQPLLARCRQQHVGAAGNRRRRDRSRGAGKPDGRARVPVAGRVERHVQRGLGAQDERVQLAAREPGQRADEAAPERRPASRLDAIEREIAAMQEPAAADDRRARREGRRLRTVDRRKRRAPADALVERSEQPLRRAEQERAPRVGGLDEERRRARVGRQRSVRLTDQAAAGEQGGGGNAHR